MNLNGRLKRIEKTVSVAEIEARPTGRNAEFIEYVSSREFYRDLHRLACETLQTMTPEHGTQAVAYWHIVDDWHQRRDAAIEQDRYEEWNRDCYRNAYPAWHLLPTQETLGKLIATMICDKFNDKYFGAFVLPENIAALWLEKGSKHISGQWNCEDCGYWFPFFNPRLEVCLLCSGKVSYFAYEFKHERQNPMVNVGGYRDESGCPILTEHKVSEILGVIYKHGGFDVFKAQSAPDEVLM